MTKSTAAVPAKYRLSLTKKSKKASPVDIAKLTAPKGAQFLYNTLRIGPRLILRSAFELMRANMVTRVLSAVVLLSFDTVSLIKKRISPKQYFINVVLALMLLVGGTAGWIVGGVAVGLVFLADAWLVIIASVVGAGVFGVGAAVLCERIIGLFVSSDTTDMLEILSRAFWDVSTEAGLADDEVERLRDEMDVSAEFLREMFVQEDRYGYAVGVVLGGLEKPSDGLLGCLGVGVQ